MSIPHSTVSEASKVGLRRKQAEEEKVAEEGSGKGQKSVNS